MYMKPIYKSKGSKKSKICKPWPNYSSVLIQWSLYYVHFIETPDIPLQPATFNPRALNNLLGGTGGLTSLHMS